MRNGATIVIVLAFMFSSFAPVLLASGVSQGPTVEWRVNLATKPYPGEPTSPQVVDLDNDGTNEIVLTSGDSLYVLRAKGTTKWRYTIDGTITGAVAANIDSNTDKEVIAVAESGTVHALSRDGSHLWAFETGSAIRAVPALADIDGNGRLEIYVGTMNGDLIVIDEKGALVKKVPVGSAIMRPIVVCPTNVPGTLSILVATQAPSLKGLDRNLTDLFEFPLDSEPSADIALGDIDKDGVLEILVSTRSTLYAVWGSNGTTNWKFGIGAIGGGQSAVVVDLDQDGMSEVVLGIGGADLAQISSDGEQGWQASLGGNLAGISPVLAPNLELIAITDQGRVESRDHNGLMVWHKDLGIKVNRSVTVADLDKDSEMEILVIGIDGQLVLLNTHQVLRSAWPMADHDIQNTRNMQSIGPGNPPLSQSWGWGAQSGWGGYSVVADVDGDGKDEIYVVDPIGDLSIIRGDGRLGEHISLSQNLFYLPLAAELNGDGGKELVIGTEKEVQARSKLLSMIWNYSLPDVSAIAACDINGDGMSEVFAANDTGQIVALKASDGVKIWSDSEGRRITSLTVADLGSDGSFELIEATTQAMAIMTVRNATTGAVLWTSKSYIYDVVPPTIADLDGDGTTDIVMGVHTGDVVAFNGTGAQMWAITLPGVPQSVIAIGGNATGQDIALTLSTGDLLIIDGRTGAILNTIKFGIPLSYAMVPVAAYLGTDSPAVVGYVDFKYFPDFPTLFWADPNELTPRLTALNGHDTSMVFGDLDADGSIEMVHGANSMVTYDLGVGPGPTVPWSMWGHDQERTFNPFSKGGKLYPDLTVGPEDITFEPLVINGNMTSNVTISYHNMGPIPSEGFNVTLANGPTKLATFNARPLAPFSDGKLTFKWAVGYENSTLDVELDSAFQVSEMRENNNKASRTLFKNQRPIAEAGPSVKADPAQPIIFDAGASKDPDGDIATYLWNFMDGTTATGPVVVHSFSHSGTFMVQLIVTDEYGATGTDNRTVLINHPPSFSNWSPKGNATMNEGERVEFWAITEDVDGDKVTLNWSLDGVEMGHGQSWSLWANYSSSGVHTVKASASDGNLTINRAWKLTITESNRLIEDATPPSPVTIPEGSSQEFILQLASAAEGANIDWLLDGHRVLSNASSFALFADIGTQGQHTLKVQVQDVNIWDFHEWSITIGPKKEVPTVRWSYPDGETISTVFGTPVYFGISSEGGSVQWFVDGVAQVAKNGPSFRFDTWGNRTYNITVLVSTSTASVSRNWTLVVDYPPTANIDASALQVKVGKKITFDGQKSKASRPTDAIQTYKWDMGDGYKAEGSLAKHSFKKAGSFKVTLTVTDTRGISSSASVVIVVLPTDQAVTPGFEGTVVLLVVVFGSMVIAFKRRFER